jgi:mRNA interferase RelE/StbE
MIVRLTPKPKKYLETLNEPIKSRIKNGLEKLEKEPPQGDIKPITGSDEFRLRIGNYRILFSIDLNQNTIFIHEIGVRGQIYKRR